MKTEEKNNVELNLLADCVNGFLKIPIEQKWFVVGYIQGMLNLDSDKESVRQKQVKA